MHKRSKLFGILLGLVVSMLPMQTSAAGPKGISVSPALQELTLSESAADVSFTFKITNTTVSTLSLRLSMLDFGTRNDSGGIAFIGRSGQETTTYGLRQWMQLEKETLVLAPEESQEIRATVANKTALAPGGHYGAIVVTAEQDTQKNNESVAVLPSASVLVLLKKTGGERLALELPTVHANHTIVSLPREVSLRFRNDGNTHVVPRGTVKIQDPMHRIVGRGIINEDTGFILPESYRVYKVPFVATPQGWMPGRYSIITSWRYDGSDQVITTVTHIWYIGLLPLITLGIIVFIICLYFVQRRLRRKKRTQA